jgi:hypothetical protein
MSRYTKQLSEHKYVAYGFDRILGYFLDVWEEGQDEDEDIYLIEESSKLTDMTNGKMIELMTLYGLPESQIEAVAMDIPF